MLGKLLCKIHVVVHVEERNFGLNHPKLSKVTRRIGVFCTESGTKSINPSKGKGCQLSL